jgi:hypothetical protein
MGVAQGFFVCRNFATWRQREWAGESNKWIFENCFKNFAISQEKKRFEVARFKQCVPLGRQN